MKNGIFIVGNGFDIHSAINSQYGSFVKSCNIEDNGFLEWLKYKLDLEGDGTWVDFEKEILTISNIIDDFFKDYNPFHGQEKVSKKYYELFKYLFGFNVTVTPEDLLYHIPKETTNLQFHERFYKHETLKNSDIIKHVHNEINQILSYFIEELNKASLLTKVDKKFIDIFKEYDNIFFFNYNFTNTLEKYKIDKNKIFYMHGTLDNPIWGHNEIKSYNFTEFKKVNKQRYRMFGNDYVKKLIDSGINNYKIDPAGNSFENEVDIIILGHSVDKNDMDLYKKLLDSDKGFKFVNLIIYQHNNDALGKVNNLFEEIGGQALENIFNSNKVEYRKFIK